ncbi:MAG TPA: hypothetical protein VN516_04905, partial [Candidatus Baltobacteraceae bacterium]|nr:hypothetical protein [Candidatus Baltobacteraceae bacterium]
GIVFVLLLQHRKKHHEWVKNRMSAEISRSFLATWDMRRRTNNFPKISPPEFNHLFRNLRLVWTFDKTPMPSLESVQQDYLNERLGKQFNYFSKKSAEAGLIYKTLKMLALFSAATATLLAMLVLTLLLLQDTNTATISDTAIRFSKCFSLLLPLAGAAIFSLLITQDYSRRAVRYAEMALMLEDAMKRLKLVRTWNSLARIAAETEEALLQEVVEWHSFRQFAGEPHSH